MGSNRGGIDGLLLMDWISGGTDIRGIATKDHWKRRELMCFYNQAASRKIVEDVVGVFCKELGWKPDESKLTPYQMGILELPLGR